jgi:hypothetical protein
MTSLLGSRCQPSHIAVVARFDEVGQAVPRLRPQARLTEADCIETYP